MNLGKSLAPMSWRSAILIAAFLIIGIQPQNLTPTVIGGVTVSTIKSKCDNSGDWILFADLDHPGSNFDNSVQVGTFNKGIAGMPAFSLDLQALASHVNGGTFDLMIQYGGSLVYSMCLVGFSLTNGSFINNLHSSTIGEHGMWGSRSDMLGGFYATFCAVKGSCRDHGMDYWAFSTNGAYPIAANAVPCGYYGFYGDWKTCPAGDNKHRMRYYVRFAIKTTTTTTMANARATTITTAKAQAITTTTGKAPYYTTTTSTTPGLSILEGALILNTTNVTQFIREPNLTAVLTTVLAKLLKVDASWIQNVIVSAMLADRRLLPRVSYHHASIVHMHERILTGMDLTTRSGAKIKFRVVIPPDGMVLVTATIVAREFNALTRQEASTVVNSFLKAGFFSRLYAAEVTYIFARAIQPPVDQAPSPGKSNADIVLTTILVTVTLSVFIWFICFIAILRFWVVSRNRRKKTPSLSVDVAEWNASDFLCIPGAIRSRLKKAMDKCSLILFSGVDSEVYVTFALGRREADVQNTGPGLLYAMAVGKALLSIGVPCTANLRHVSLSMRQDDGADLIVASNTQIKMLIVVETLALYHCEWCLREIFAALESNIEVIRLQFEVIPDGYERWPQINLLNGNICYQIGPRTFSLEEIKMSVLAKFDVISPPPSSTVQHMMHQQQHFLQDMAADIQSKLMVAQPSPPRRAPPQELVPLLDAGEEGEIDSVQKLSQSIQPEVQILCHADGRAASKSGRPCRRINKERDMTPGQPRSNFGNTQRIKCSPSPTRGGHILGEGRREVNRTKAGGWRKARHNLGTGANIGPTCVGHCGSAEHEQAGKSSQLIFSENPELLGHAQASPTRAPKTRRRSTAKDTISRAPVGNSDSPAFAKACHAQPTNTRICNHTQDSISPMRIGCEQGIRAESSPLQPPKTIRRNKVQCSDIYSSHTSPPDARAHNKVERNIAPKSSSTPETSKPNKIKNTSGNKNNARGKYVCEDLAVDDLATTRAGKQKTQSCDAVITSNQREQKR